MPDGVVFCTSKSHKEPRRMLVEDQKLGAVISLPSGVFKRYAGVCSAISLFSKTNSGGADSVWFYDMKADGWSLEGKRQPLRLERAGLRQCPLTGPHLPSRLRDLLVLSCH